MKFVIDDHEFVYDDLALPENLYTFSYKFKCLGCGRVIWSKASKLEKESGSYLNSCDIEKTKQIINS
jgi:hypothetical protein